MLWLITGGCEFIGRNLVKNLVAAGGHTIRIVDNLSVGGWDDLARVCDFTEINPDDVKLQYSVLNPPTSIAHLIIVGRELPVRSGISRCSI